MGILMWLADKILQALGFRTKIKILVHEACFIGDQNKELYYFVKVINCSSEAPFTITHIWARDGSKEVHILNPDKPLPHKLERSDIWETWFRKNNIQDQVNIFKNVHVLLSNGKIYKSKGNKTVPPIGHVA